MKKLTKKLYPMSLVLQGFSYRTAKEFSMVRKSVDERRAKYIMRKLPFHVTFDKMFADLLTTRRVLWEVREAFPHFLALYAKRDTRVVICPLEDAGQTEKLSSADMTRLLRQYGALLLRPCYSALKGRADQLVATEDGALLNGKPLTQTELGAYFENRPEDTIVTECKPCSAKYGCAYPVFHAVYLHNSRETSYLSDHLKNDRLHLFGSSVQTELDFDDPMLLRAQTLADRIAQKYPEAPYLNIGVTLTDDAPTIWQVDVGKELIWLSEIPNVIDAFLAGQRAVPTVAKEQNGLKRVWNYAFAAYAKKKGFLDYMYRNWLRGLKDDNSLTITTAEQKRWAHRRGFYSYRIKQYGLTEQNYREMLSDYEYKRLRPINGWYQKWLWDKVFMYYVMAPFQRYLPEHYYRIIPDAAGNRIIPFDLDAPQRATVEDLYRLIAEKGRIVAKPAIGSHGKGFYKLAWDGAMGGVLINDAHYSKEAFADFIAALDKPYFLSEFAEMHDDLKRIYDGVVGTVRVMVIDIDSAPKVESAYMRIGSSTTGHTDNLDSGGIVARVDAETGRYYGAEMLMVHEFVPCTVHPDTGTPLEGTLPHWERIKASLQEIAAYLYPLEYLGFDVVIKNDGFCILEINTHQDLHRFPEYPQEVKDYFKRKSALKK